MHAVGTSSLRTVDWVGRGFGFGSRLACCLLAFRGLGACGSVGSSFLRRSCLFGSRAFARRAAPTAAEASGAALGSLLNQHPTLLECQRLGIPVFRDLGVLLAVGDVWPVASIQHLDAVTVR